jgi:hypothetical protein
MERVAGKETVLKVVARGDDSRRYEGRLPDHGFFNSRNSELPELPLRAWGRSDRRAAASPMHRLNSER